MAGQKFQYDESGSTFFYFILSFLALILIPATFYFWPKKKTEGKFHQFLKDNSKSLKKRALCIRAQFSASLSHDVIKILILNIFRSK